MVLFWIGITIYAFVAGSPFAAMISKALPIAFAAALVSLYLDGLGLRNVSFIILVVTALAIALLLIAF